MSIRKKNELFDESEPFLLWEVKDWLSKNLSIFETFQAKDKQRSLAKIESKKSPDRLENANF